MRRVKSGIYEIVCATNGHRYIGSAVDIDARWHAHKCDLRKGRHHSQILQRAWLKHGQEGFKFRRLLVCNKQNLLFYEQRFLDAWKPFYNISPTAKSPLGVKHSAETRAKVSAAGIGRRLSEEAKLRMRLLNTGRKHTDAARAKMRAAQQERGPISESTRAKLSAALVGNGNLLGHTHTPETRLKIAAANTGRTASQATREKISAAHKGHHRRLGCKFTDEHKAKLAASVKSSWARRKQKVQA